MLDVRVGSWINVGMRCVGRWKVCGGQVVIEFVVCSFVHV